MNKQRVLSDAKNIFFQLKREERNKLNPYASLASQVVGLIAKGGASSKEDILQYMKISYPRPRMNGQWRTFRNVLQKNMRPMDKMSLLYLFGFLKRLLTIEGKKEDEKKRKDRAEGQKRKDQRRKY